MKANTTVECSGMRLCVSADVVNLNAEANVVNQVKYFTLFARIFEFKNPFPKTVLIYRRVFEFYVYKLMKYSFENGNVNSVKFVQ